MHPAITIHSLVHARLAVAAGRPVCLLSAEAAAIFAGCLWWRGIVASVQAEHVQDLLDCGDAPGRAMAALRVGQRRLVLDGSCAGFAAVVSAAAELGAVVTPVRPPALDLGEPGAARHLGVWLAQGDTPPPLS